MVTSIRLNEEQTKKFLKCLLPGATELVKRRQAERKAAEVKAAN